MFVSNFGKSRNNEGLFGENHRFLEKTIGLWNDARDDPSKEKKLLDYLQCMRDQINQYIQQIDTSLELLEEQLLRE